MRKKFLVFLTAILIIFAFPYSFAHEDEAEPENHAEDIAADSVKSVEGNGTGEAGTRTEVEKRELIGDSAGNVAGDRITRAKTETRIRADKDEIMGRDVFKKLRVEEREKLEKLSGEHLETLSNLRTDQIAKFRTVGNEGLRVLASEGETALDKFARLQEADIEKVAKLDRSRIKEFAELAPSEIQARLKNIRIIEAKGEEEFKFRPLTLEQTKRSEKAFEKLKDNEEKLRERYEERKEKLIEAKEKVRACKNDSSTENCANADDEAIARAKGQALSAVERVLNHLEKVKEKVESSEDLPDNYVKSYLEKINELVGEVNQLQSKIEAATTRKDFNEAVKELKKIVSKVKKASITRAQALIRAQTLGVVHRAEIMEKKMDCSLSALDAAGEDTSALDAKVEEFSQLIADARAKLEEAKEVYDASDNDAVEQSRALLADARNLAHDAQQKLVEIKKEIVDLGGKPCVKAEVAVDESEFEVEEPEGENNKEGLDEDENESIAAGVVSCPVISPPAQTFCPNGETEPRYAANDCIVGYDCIEKVRNKNETNTTAA